MPTPISLQRNKEKRIWMSDPQSLPLAAVLPPYPSGVANRYHCIMYVRSGRAKGQAVGGVHRWALVERGGPLRLVVLGGLRRPRQYPGLSQTSDKYVQLIIKLQSQPCIQETYFHSPGLYAPRPEPHYRSAVFDQPCDNPRTFNHPETPYRPTVLDQPCDNPRQPHIKETYLHESNFSRPEPHYRPIFQDLFSDNPSTQYLKPTLDIKGTKCSDTVYRNPPVWADSPFAGLQNLPTVDDIFRKNKKKKNKRDIKKENAVTRHIEEIRRKQNKIDKIDNDDSMKTQLNIPGMVSSKTVYRTSPVWAAPNTYLPHPPTAGPAPDEPYGPTKARVKYCDFRSANSVSQHLDELKRKQSKIKKVTWGDSGTPSRTSAQTEMPFYHSSPIEDFPKTEDMNFFSFNSSTPISQAEDLFPWQSPPWRAALR
ncbi:uncharacterized protein LOC100498554 [Xenopus tropicalis]|uniref:Uncharacterized protein LOC100498554 n=2 Tax=Xenopus tropicalis TaxID=8364 RepID=A0A8J1JC72_XENTR|nr:uncharacterized protein LOC100498554 [Xenopus tropicalis]